MDGRKLGNFSLDILHNWFGYRNTQLAWSTHVAVLSLPDYRALRSFAH